MKLLNNIWENRIFIFFIVLLTFMLLFFKQCDDIKKYKSEVEQIKFISEQNIAALTDKEIQLKVTEKQLYQIDSSLYIAKLKIDSLTGVKSKQITKVKLEYLPKNIITSSELVYDSIRMAYGLVFNTEDLVRTIHGTSYFKIDTSQTKLIIYPDSTVINNFNLNFSLVISQYDDPITKYTRTRIVPFYINPDKTLGKEIPNSILALDFRNAEILDKPYQTQPKISNKIKRHEGIALTFNPIAVGVYPSDNGLKFGLVPNIGIGYYITFKK